MKANAPALMILGTGSHAGKSVLAAGLCRLFRQRGLRVAPFKAQNMSLNSAAVEGGEIGRAQAVQAAACGLSPNVDMNPVLLKPAGPGHCQLIVQGRPHGTISSRNHGIYGAEVIAAIRASYARLARTVDLMVIEGAGSPAEINLSDRDFANMWMADQAGAACLLVADIERGGAFAALYGTWSLVPSRHRIGGFVLNKFRGDASLLDPGNQQLEALTGVPMLAVLPFLDPNLPEEDSLALPVVARGPEAFATADVAMADLDALRIGVLRFPHLSNFTDFEPLQLEPGVALRYIWDAEAMAACDVLILPGTKSTVADLGALRASGLESALRRAVEMGTPVLGICGGYQMLGRAISDPANVESPNPQTTGLGWLPVHTVFEPGKRVERCHGRLHGTQIEIEGYVMQHGRITRAGTGESWIDIDTGTTPELEGCVLGRIWGTSLHGLFESAALRRYAIKRWCTWAGKSDPAGHPESPATISPTLDARLDRWADFLRPHFDLDALLALARGQTQVGPALEPPHMEQPHA